MSSRIVISMRLPSHFRYGHLSAKVLVKELLASTKNTAAPIKSGLNTTAGKGPIGGNNPYVGMELTMPIKAMKRAIVNAAVRMRVWFWLREFVPFITWPLLIGPTFTEDPAF